MKSEKPKLLWSSGFKALGTEIKIFLVLEKGKSREEASEDAEGIKNIYRIKEKIFSRFDPGSELVRLNSRLNVFQDCSPDILYSAKKSLEYNKTSPYFDPRILETLENIGYADDFKTHDFEKHKTKENKFFSDRKLSEDLKIIKGQIFFGKRMDFSGLAKGYITDQAAGYLRKHGWNNFLVDSGGDIYASGRNEEDDFWKVDMEGISREKIILKLNDSAAATSGITRRKWEIGEERYHHLVDPLDPCRFSFDLKSVSVTEKKCEKADVYAKILFLLGKEKGLEFSARNRVPAVFLDCRGDAYLSENMKNMIN